MFNDIWNNFRNSLSTLDWQADVLPFIFSNFALCMFVLAAFFMLLHRMVSRGRVSQSEIVYRWLAVFSLGFTGIYYFILQVFYPEFPAGALNFPMSPFQFTVGMGSLAFGLMGILSFKASLGFRQATVLGSTIWLWGCAGRHVYEMARMWALSGVVEHSWFWMELLIPVLLILCVLRLKSEHV